MHIESAQNITARTPRGRENAPIKAAGFPPPQEPPRGKERANVTHGRGSLTPPRGETGRGWGVPRAYLSRALAQAGQKRQARRLRRAPSDRPAGAGNRQERYPAGGCPGRRTTRRGARGKPAYLRGKPAYKTPRRTDKTPRKGAVALRASRGTRGERFREVAGLVPARQGAPARQRLTEHSASERIRRFKEILLAVRSAGETGSGGGGRSLSAPPRRPRHPEAGG